MSLTIANTLKVTVICPLGVNVTINFIPFREAAITGLKCFKAKNSVWSNQYFLYIVRCGVTKLLLSMGSPVSKKQKIFRIKRIGLTLKL